MSKGRRTLNKAKEYFINNGWLVDECEQGGKFRKYKDAFAGYCIYCWTRKDNKCCKKRELFDGFDLISLKKDSIILSQIKTNTPPKQKGFKMFAKQFANESINVWIMTWYDYKGWRIQKYLPNGKIKEVDLRK